MNLIWTTVGRTEKSYLHLSKSLLASDAPRRCSIPLWSHTWTCPSGTASTARYKRRSAIATSTSGTTCTTISCWPAATRCSRGSPIGWRRWSTGGCPARRLGSPRRSSASIPRGSAAQWWPRRRTFIGCASKGPITTIEGRRLCSSRTYVTYKSDLYNNQVDCGRDIKTLARTVQ